QFGSKDILSTTKSIGESIIKLSDCFAEVQPDIILVGADRYESFAAMIAATQLNIPTAHFEGGDITQGGALDDSLRHSMTKLAHIHFTTNYDSKDRVLKLGEEDWRVHDVGFPGIDALASSELVDTKKLCLELGIDIKKPLILFTQHSITTEPEQAIEQIKPSLEALNEMALEKDCQILITYPNNDAGGQKIISEIEKFQLTCSKNIQVLPHLGYKRYQGVLNICGIEGTGVCVGNSSSGIKETPIFFCPSIIIGTRQDGRLRAGNVINTGYNKDEIKLALIKSLFDKDFRDHCKKIKNPYGNGNASTQIANILATVEINKKLLNKKITY
ncbi:MAG: UDP-N-acetylglucosamine 2-epimerase, partial [Bacteroidetes bacterium]|nr:UDP-N-acetylglucosamine 2-epimerase [Bacteroidota bacterium]